MKPILRSLSAALRLACAGTLLAANPAAAEEFLERYAATHQFRLGRPTSAQVTPDGRTVLFLRSPPRNFAQDLYAFDVESGVERLLLRAEDLLGSGTEQLDAAELARRERQRLAARGIAAFELSPDGRRVLIPFSGRLFVLELDGSRPRELAGAAGTPLDARWSPDGGSVSCVRDGELHVIDLQSGAERRLTHGAGPGIEHGLAEFVAQEEMSRKHGYWWSPDSKFIAYQQTDTNGLEVMHIMDPGVPQQAPATWPYPRPGKRNARVRLGIVPAAGGETTWVRWDHERYEYLAGVTWSLDAPLTVTLQNRRQTELVLLEVDPRRGTTSELLAESDPAWVDLDERMPVWLSGGRGFLWTTERNGAWQLELRARDGSLQRELTATGLGMQRFEHYFESTDTAVVRASTYPPEAHLFRVGLEPAAAAPQRWTLEAGQHESGEPRRGPLLAAVSLLHDGQIRFPLIDAAGRVVGRLRSVAEEPGLMPRLELTTVGDRPEFHAALLRPRDFQPDRRYPVIVHVYGGPTSQMVRAAPDRYLLDQWLADHGYIVVAIDGRGTPGRGSRWQRAVQGDLIRLPLEDQVAALSALGRKYPELDLSRVGIYGWSFGGYFSAMAVMQRPDAFHVGVAGAPVVDWLDYDTHYTERYMNLPENNAAGYTAASLLTYVEQLRRPLLLIHGTSDDNVYFMHSLKLAQALFRAGKPFEFLPLAGFTHMVPDPLVTRRLYERILLQFDSRLKPAPGREGAAARGPE